MDLARAFGNLVSAGVIVMSGAVQTGTGVPVVWDYAWWQLRYPDLATWTGPGAAEGYFEIATMYLDNTATSVVQDTGRRQILLGMLVAHIAQLNAPLNGQPPSTLVGRVASAAEGSVNVAVEYPPVPNAEWFTQTKWGAMYWAATAIYRHARYYPGPQPFREGSTWPVIRQPFR